MTIVQYQTIANCLEIESYQVMQAQDNNCTKTMGALKYHHFWPLFILLKLISMTNIMKITE